MVDILRVEVPDSAVPPQVHDSSYDSLPLLLTKFSLLRGAGTGEQELFQKDALRYAVKYRYDFGGEMDHLVVQGLVVL